jgi:iron-sulfur cluster assembly protein
MISTTVKAAEALRSYAQIHKKLTVSLSLKAAGCTGYKYHLALVERRTPGYFTIDLGDGYTLEVSEAHAALLEGTVIDYEKRGLNHLFVYHNPNVKALCGCGESFNA